MVLSWDAKVCEKRGLSALDCLSGYLCVLESVWSNFASVWYCLNSSWFCEFGRFIPNIDLNVMYSRSGRYNEKLFEHSLEFMYIVFHRCLYYNHTIANPVKHQSFSINCWFYHKFEFMLLWMGLISILNIIWLNFPISNWWWKSSLRNPIHSTS